MIRDVAELMRFGRVSRLVFDLEIEPEQWCEAMARTGVDQDFEVETRITHNPWTVHAVRVDGRRSSGRQAGRKGSRQTG